MNRWNVTDIPDQSGRLAIVTGGSGGLGFEAARALAGKGLVVVIACRSKDKGAAARRLILARYPGADVRVTALDVSSLASVREFAAGMNSRCERIDLLINNAGIMAVPYAASADGFEMQFATNHLGHFALTGLLLPRLAATPGSRVVPVASLAARAGAIDFGDLMGQRRYKPWKAYNQSKLANLLFGIELQRRLAQAGAATSAVTAHPGVSATQLFATPAAEIGKRVFMPLLHPLFQPAERGALPILFAATSALAEPGGYYGPDGLGEMKGFPAPARVPAQARDSETAARLWEVSAQLTGVSYL